MIDFKQIGLRTLPYLAILLVGAGVGWFFKPDVVRTEEREKIVESQVTAEALKELMTQFESLKTELQKVRETQVTERYHRETLETWLADGSHTKKDTVDKNIDSHTKETETKVEVRVVEVEKVVEKEKVVTVDRVVEKEKIVTPVLAQWRASALVGVQPQILPVPAVSSYVVGGEVERRVAGPFWGGLWGAGTTTGQAMGGLKLSVEF